jgi:hypothetical protein
MESSSHQIFVSLAMEKNNHFNDDSHMILATSSCDFSGLVQHLCQAVLGIVSAAEGLVLSPKDTMCVL